MHVFMTMNFNGVIDFFIIDVFIIDVFSIDVCIIDVFITTGTFRAISVVFSTEKILDLITRLNVSLSFEHYMFHCKLKLKTNLSDEICFASNKKTTSI